MSDFFPNAGSTPSGTSKEDQNWAVILHLSCLTGFIVPLAGFLAPVVIWLLKKDQSTYLDEEGKEVLNFLITMAIAGIFSTALCLILVGFALLWLLGIWIVIVPIIAAIKTSQGVRFKYPFVLRLLK